MSNFFNDESKKQAFRDLNYNKVETLYKLQRTYLLQGVKSKLKFINLVAELFAANQGYSRDKAFKAFQNYNPKEGEMGPPKSRSIKDMERDMSLLKGKIQVGEKALNHRIDAVKRLTNDLFDISTQTNGSLLNYVNILEKAGRDLASMAATTNGDKKQKFNVPLVLEDVKNNMSLIKGDVAEYLALGWSEIEIEKMMNLTENKNKNIKVINTGKNKVDTAIRFKNLVGSLNEMTDSRDLTYIVSINGVTMELGLTVKNYNYFLATKFGVSLRASNFNSVLPVLTGANNIGFKADDSLLKAFTYAFHGLKYNWIAEKDIEDIRKLIGTILFTITVSQNDLAKAMQFSLMNDTFKKMTGRNAENFLPKLEDIKLGSSGTIKNSTLKTIAPSSGMTDTIEYLARYIGLSLHVKLMNQLGNRK